MKSLLKNPDLYMYIAWIQTALATFGSLYFSEVLRFAPCVLCWYQRIFTYPLMILIPLGLCIKDKNLAKYVLAITIPGFLLAVYHNLLYYKIIVSSETCLFNVSCTTEYINYFGFITIPLLALLAFIVVIASAIISIRLNKVQNV